MLGPDEQFTLINLSGGKPKVPNKIKAICQLLGPEFSTVYFLIFYNFYYNLVYKTFEMFLINT